MPHYDDLTEQELASLELLTDEEVPYEQLSDTILRKLALRHELFIATSSLIHLDSRQSALAVPTASEILERRHGDGHLQAAALSVLFDRERPRAIAYLEGAAATCDPLVIREFLRNVAREGLGPQAPTLTSLRSRIDARVKDLEDDPEILDEVAREGLARLHAETK